MLRRPLSHLALLLSLLALLTAACRSSKPSGPTLGKPLLWSAQKDGRTTYLLGTVHAGFNAEKQLPKWVWDKLAAASALAVETNVTDPRLMSMGVRQDGKSLRDELGEEYYRKLVAELGEGSAIDRMTPSGAISVLQLKNFPPAMAMDLMLLGEAESAGKKIVYLEDALLQLAVLEKWMDVRALKVALDQVKKGKEQAAELLAAYTAGDDGKLGKLAEQREEFLATGRSEAEYAEMMEDVLYRRNASWIDGIEKLHREEQAVVAVGALHLIGDKSVLELLRARGYQITRVERP